MAVRFTDWKDKNNKHREKLKEPHPVLFAV